MADLNDLNGNFVDPATATPEQIKQMRIYADLLQQQSVQPTAKHWTGALAQALMGFNAAYTQNRATQLEQGGIRSATQQDQNAPVIQHLMGNPTQPQANNGASYGDNAPRGIRNNNPGNIEDGPFAKSMPGYQGSDGRFAKFASAEDGKNAMDSLLSTYGNKGINTTQGVINRWAPPNENNSTAYAATVAKQLGVDPSTPINMADPAVRAKLANGITGYENGPRYAQSNANGSGFNPQAYSAYQHNPWANPKEQDLARRLITPEVGQDVGGMPTATSPVSGTQPLPVNPNIAAPGPGAPVALSPGNITAGAGTLRALPGLLGGQQGQPGQPGNTLGGLKPLQDELIDQGARKAGADVEAGKTAAMLGEFKGEGVQAKTLSGQLDTLKQLGSKVGYGLGPAMQNRMAELGIYTPGVSEIQAYQNFIPYVGVLLRPEGSGRLMSQELSQFNQALGGLMVTPEGRATAMESLSRIAHYRTKIANIANDDKVSQNDRMKQINELPLPQLNWSEIKRYSNQNTNQPSAAHIDALKKNPTRREEFNMKFGNGAADRVLGPQ